MKRAEGFLRVNNPILWALIASSIVVVLILLFAVAPTCNFDIFPKGDCPAKWRHLMIAPLNEVGDTLAGLAGVFAFIWLIATVLLQAQELREQRKEFRDQRIATQAMANAMAEQAKVFEDEQKGRKQDQTEQLLNELLTGICDDISIIPLCDVSWLPHQQSCSSQDSIRGKDNRIHLFWNTDRSRHNHEPDILTGTPEREEFLKKQSFHVLEFLGTVLFYLQNRKDQDFPFDELPQAPLELHLLVKKLNRILDLEERLSPSQVERVRNLRISDLSNALTALIGVTQLWSGEGVR